MSALSFNTAALQQLLPAYAAGDRAAGDRLFALVNARMARIARHMLRRWPAVRAWAETGDLLARAQYRLMRRLQQAAPATTGDFFRLAALEVRRALSDLAREARRHVLSGSPPGLDRPDHRAEAAEDLEVWARFHEAVASLPDDLRQVVELRYYQGHRPRQVAELLGWSESKVSLCWRHAGARLSFLLGEQLPI